MLYARISDIPELPDTLNACCDEVLKNETDYLKRENAKLLFKTVDRKKVETPHNYYPNTDEEKLVRIPGATHLCITFDERCNLVRMHGALYGFSPALGYV